MATEIKVPVLGESVTEGTIAEWVAADGAEVKQGDVIYILETNKTSRDIEAPVSGKLVHKAAAGETYDVGTEIGEIV